MCHLISTPGLAPNKVALLKPLLRERIYERVGTGGDVSALAMHIFVCASVGLETSDTDKGALLKFQLEDGSWEAGWFYKYGATGKKIGNRGVTTKKERETYQATLPLYHPEPPCRRVRL